MRIAITGGFGYVGAWLVRGLKAAGHEVTVTSLHPPAIDLPADVAGVPHVLADVTDRVAMRGAFEGADAVVHAAAMGAGPAAADPARALAVNGHGTRVVIDEAARAGARVVYLSTYHVYGREHGIIDEATTARPVSDYGISKQAGEGFCFRAARRGEVPVTILRFSNGFGAPLARSADCWSLAFPSFCFSAAEKGLVELLSAGQQQRDFLTLGDMCAGVVAVLEAPALFAGDTDIVYNVGGGRSMPMREAASVVAEEYRRLTGRDIAVTLPAGAEDAPEEPTVDYRFDRIASLGYRPAGDLAAEARETLRLLGVGDAR